MFMYKIISLVLSLRGPGGTHACIIIFYIQYYSVSNGLPMDAFTYNG